MSRCITSFALLAALLVWGCSRSASTVDCMDNFEAAMEQEHYGEAQRLVESMTDADALPALSVEQLCRYALAALRLGEYHDEDANLIHATRCMQEALNRDPDSVAVCLVNMPIEDRSVALLLSRLTAALDYDFDLTELPADTIPADSDFIPQMK